MDALGHRNLTYLSLVRILKLKNIKSLAELSEEVVLKNIDRYLGAESRGEKLITTNCETDQRILYKLLSQRCDRGNESISDYHKILQCVALIIHPVQDIDVSNLMNFCPNQFKLQELANMVGVIDACSRRNLRFLTLSSAESSKVSLTLGKPICADLSSFARLQHLRITEYKIEYDDLKMVCRKLKNLRCLEVKIAFKTRVFREASHKDFDECFGGLETFLFEAYLGEYPDPGITGQLTEFCLRSLSNLRIVQSRADDRFRSAYDLPLSLLYVISALSHLSIRLSNFMNAAEITTYRPYIFVNVTDLKIVWFDENDLKAFTEDKLMRFKMLQSLVLFDCPSEETLTCILRHYGSYLRTLALKNHNQSLQCSFESISKLCPRLETLVLYEVDVTDSDNKIEGFANLKHLKWTPKSQCGKKHLSSILHAPNLEKIYLRGVDCFDVEDLQRLASLINQGRVLRKLTTFSFLGHPYRNSEAAGAFVRALLDVAMNASAFLPHLVDLETMLESELATMPDANLITVLSAYKLLKRSALRSFK